MLNHLPVIGAWFGLAFLVIALIRKNTTLLDSALGILIFSALICIPTLLTGDPAEDMVRHMPGVTRQIIHAHEEAAELTFWVMELVGALALVGVVMRMRGVVPPTWYRWLLLLGALAVSGLMLWTSNLGGQVRHTEIRSAETAIPAPGENGAPGNGASGGASGGEAPERGGDGD